MKNIIILILSTVLTSISGNSQTYEWAKGMGSSGHDQAESIVVDVNGNSYTTGWFRNTVDFDPGVGVQNITSNGSVDMFVLKLDANGDFVWVKQLGGIWDEQAYGIVINSSGDLLISGFFQNTVDFDPGAGVHNLSTQGGEDMFLLKLNQQGDFVWVKHFDGTTQNTTDCYDISLDNNDNIYMTGRFNDATDFDAGMGNEILYSLVGGYSVFVLKLNPNGDFIWVKQMDGISNTFGKSIGVDGNGNVFVTGEYKNTVDFDPGANIHNLISVGYVDVFIQKLDISGNFDWAYSFGNTAYDRAYDLTTDDNNAVYFTGNVGVSDFNVDGTGPAMSGNGHYILKIEANNNVDWVKLTDGSDYSGDITYKNGYIYSTAGVSAGTNLDMNPNAGTDLFTSAGSYDGYVQKLDTTGAYVWTIMYGGTDDEFTDGIFVSNSNDIYTTGRHQGISDMDFTNTTDFIQSVGSADIFVHKISQCSAVNGTDIQSACGTYQWIDGTTYSANNTTATHTLVGGASNGCDSIVTLDLTINTSTTGTDIQSACNTYQWIDGTTYSVNNTTATHTIVGGASNGCDSIVTLDLTILQTNTSTYNDTICEDDPYVFGTQTLNYGGQFVEIFQNQAGCDSVVTLNLFAEVLPIANITMVGNDLQANMGGNSYQWYFNGTTINGETNQIHTPTQNGGYTVDVISQRGCTKTSMPFTVEGLGLNTNNFNFSVSPNPSNGVFTINTDVNFSYKVYNVIGELIIESNSNKIDLSTNKTGIYFLKIETTNGTVKTIKLIKQ